MAQRILVNDTAVSAANPLPANVQIGTQAQLAASPVIAAQNMPWQSLRVSEDPTTLFADSFDTLDTTNRWVLGAGGSAIAPTVSGSVLTIQPTAVVSKYVLMSSQANFPQVSQSYLSPVFVIKIDAAVTTNQYRFFGVGNAAAVPTVAAPVVDGIGFEITTAGALNAVVWQSSARTVTIPLTIPTDTNYHRYSVYYKTSRVYWFQDNSDVAVATANLATTGYAPPAASALPLVQLSVNDPTTPPTVDGVAATATTFKAQFVGMNDYGRNAVGIADGVLPWRKATVTASGSLVVTTEQTKATYRAAVTGVTPVATPTAFVQLKGSASKTIRVKAIRLTGVATANGNMPVNLVRRSTIGTQGSAAVTAITPGKLDTGDATATLTVGYVQTANWTTLGTAAGLLGAKRLFLATTGTGQPQVTEFEFARNTDKALILRGVSDWVYVEFGGAAVPAGGLIDIEILWEEDQS